MRTFPIAILAAVACAQTASFEAATIKPASMSERSFHFTVLPNRLDVKNMSLGYLIEQAFDLPAFEVSAPDGVYTRRFDVLATTGAPASGVEMRPMLQTLLRERFHLATHWEEQTKSIFRLEALPGGPKMKVADHGYAAPNSPMIDGNAVQLSGPMSMRQLAERLTSQAGKPVLDATKLDGYFTIDLTFASANMDLSKEGAIAVPLPKALEQQLGLKLVAAKEPIKILVVDHADTVPTEN